MVIGYDLHSRHLLSVLIISYLHFIKRLMLMCGKGICGKGNYVFIFFAC